MPDATELIKVLAAFGVLLLIPGQDMVLVSHVTLTHSVRRAMWVVTGISTGILCHIGLAAFGVGMVLTNSPEAFRLLEIFGGAYLVLFGLFCLYSLIGKNLGRYRILIHLTSGLIFFVIGLDVVRG